MVSHLFTGAAHCKLGRAICLMLASTSASHFIWMLQDEPDNMQTIDRKMWINGAGRDLPSDQTTSSGFSDVTLATALVSRASCGRLPFNSTSV